VVDRWHDAVAQVAAVPQDVDPNSVYPHNTDFWEAVMTIAIQIATTAEAPSRWGLVKQTAQKFAEGIPQRLKSFWDDILSHPLVSIGIGAGSVVFLYLLTRPRRSNTETRP
jgi:hypothetical protein